MEMLTEGFLKKQSEHMDIQAISKCESDRQQELENNLIAWQDKYDRLHESHKRIQKINQTLEDKLLKLVERGSAERAQLTSDIATLSVHLTQANFNISKLQREIERYKTDIHLAIQLLQCNPEGFVSRKLSSLSADMQSKILTYMRFGVNSNSDFDGSTIGMDESSSYKILPVSDTTRCPFPPTAMIYSMRGIDTKPRKQNHIFDEKNIDTSKDSFVESSNLKSKISVDKTLNSILSTDMISPVMAAKFLENELLTSEEKHCATCKCIREDNMIQTKKGSPSYTVSTQTLFQDMNEQIDEHCSRFCLRCNSNLNSPSNTNNSYILNISKSSNSSGFELNNSDNNVEKIITPVKNDHLKVNSLLSHHKLCSHTINNLSTSECRTNSSENILLKMVHAPSYDNYNEKAETLIEINDTFKKNSVEHGLQLAFLNREQKPVGLFENNVDYFSENNHNTINNCNDDFSENEKPLLCFAVQHSLDDFGKKTPKSTLNTSSNQSAVNNSLKQHSKVQTINNANIQNNKNSRDEEGVRSFENFNKKLIKTIKADNPKLRGPRLCSIRIQQNGQNNILLDTMESLNPVKPIIYKRRQRLLDEELDDTKDIITMLATNDKSEEKVDSTMMKFCCDNKDLIDAGDHKEGFRCQYYDNENYINENKTKKHIKYMIKTENLKDVSRENSVIDLIELKMSAEQQKTVMSDEAYSEGFKYHWPPNCTNLGDTADYKGNNGLRKQQLSRVAEWIHNNSQLQQFTKNYTHKSSISTLNCKESQPIDNISVDSDYKTTLRLQTIDRMHNEVVGMNQSITDSILSNTKINNNIDSNRFKYYNDNQISQASNYVKHSPSSLYKSIKYNIYETNNVSPVLSEQTICDIINSKYYFPDEAKINQGYDNQTHLQTVKSNVDFVQMEYNVKQFLLKQNEWSMSLKQLPGTEIHLNKNTTGTLNNFNSKIELQKQSVHHSKLLTGTGLKEDNVCIPRRIETNL